MRVIKSFFQKPYLYLFIVLIGVSLKFYKLDQQFFWDDEICTILHTSGISLSEYEKSIPENTILHKAYFDRLLNLNSRDLNVCDQIKGLVRMPQLTPGHYYYMIFLTKIFGDDYMVYRYFSVFVFLLSIPVLFNLSKKIFVSKLSAWITISLYSISPFFQVYVQEARYYPLWAFSLILLNYIFILTIENKKKRWWILYAIYGAIAVQTTIMMFVTILSHLIYTFVYYKHQLKKVLIGQLAIFLSSLPWLIYVYINRGDINDHLGWLQITDKWHYFSLLFIKHFINIISTFSYSNYFPFDDGIIIILNILVGLIIISFSTSFFKKANSKQKWFVSMMAFMGVIFIGFLDIIRSTWILGVPRYSLMSFIGFFVLIGFAFYKGIEKKAILYGFLFLIIVSLGFSSSIYLANDTAKTYFKGKTAQYFHNDANGIFSGTNHILIVTDCKLFPFTSLISMLNACENENIDIVYSHSGYCNYKKDFKLNDYDKVYFAYISDDMLNYLSTIFNENEIKEVDSYNTYIYNKNEELKYNTPL